MADDKLDLLGPVLAKIGVQAMEIVGGEPDGVYLYIEAGDGWSDISLFKEDHDAVRYIDTGDSDIWKTVIDAWCLEPEDKRWTEMEYMIDGGKFDVKFHFDDLESMDLGSGDRRNMYLDARYGDKPIVYPPWPHRR